MPREGSHIGRFRLLRLLGRGGMGEVYLAEDEQLRRHVAIKVIQADAPDADATRLFLREARAIAMLNHPHILPLFDFGEATIGATTLTYMVMPFCHEGTLATWMQQHRPAALLSPHVIGSLIQQAASALQYAHTQQIVHQDVKPSNFLIRSREDPSSPPDLLLADFGVARSISATATMSQTVRGTPAYMAPEQWDGIPVPATDQYALAILAYDLVTGHPPFQGGLGQVMYQHLHVRPQPPSTRNPRLPADLDTVLLHALAKKPEERFASISAFAHAFQQALAGDFSSPTVANTLPEPGRSDIHAALTISEAEALAGTHRLLTLPGGRHVPVTLPAGIQDGQMIRFEGQVEAASDRDSRGALILTITIASSEEQAHLTSAANEATVISTGSEPNANGAAEPAPQELMPPQTQESVSAPDSGADQLPPASVAEALPVVPHESRVPPGPSRQQSFVAQRSLDQPSSQPQGISRRAVVLGLAGLAIVGAVGGGLVWLTHEHSGFSDEFNGQLDPRWIWVDPDGNSARSVTDQGFLRISLPSADRDLYPANNLNAPRLLQSITGDFTVETRIRFNPTFFFEGAGILVWENETRFLRLDRAYVDFSGISFEQNVNGTYTRILSLIQSIGHPGPIVTATLVDLRLQRTGNTFTASWRDPSSSQSWQSLAETSIRFNRTSVGLILLSEAQSGNPPNVTTSADYDYFRVS
jgi:serine/threonine protein kinase/regulation of enolase protein 1 (concanavalin A-like superfamily)